MILNWKNDNFNDKITTKGCLECFCGQMITSDPNGWQNFTVSTADFGDIKICSEFRYYAYFVFFAVKMLTIVVVVLNFFLREICIRLINWVGYKTETVRIAKVTKLTFIVTFLNTALLQLLINANLSEQPITLSLNGPYNDFNSDWFRLTGNLILTTMIINAFWPIFEFVMYALLRIWARLRDSRCRLNKYSTKKTSVHDYIEIWSGDKFYIHFKYAAVLNIVFVTFLFGFGMPILFPIAAFSFLIIYVIDVLLLYYSYRAPPAYDKKISDEVLSLIKYAPIPYLAFAYWMVSSR